jgi:hypothetical protein
MAKVSYKQRIISLIELNKTNAEIKKIIYEEYNIVVQLSDIELKRNSNYIVRFNEIEKTGKETTEKLIKNILIENLNYPLTKKEIIYKILKNYKLNISRDEVKDILWGKLKNEIIYDRNDWTYRLKNKIKNEINEIENPTLNQYLKNNISDIIKELYGKIQFSLTVNFSEEFLYNEVNDIHDFDFHNELCFEKLQKKVLKNYNLLKKMYNIIQNIPSIVSLKNEIIENDEDINETDLNYFTNTFNSLFEVDEEKIRIKNNFFFNQTKDELEFLYEAYQSYFNILQNYNIKTTIESNDEEVEEYTSLIDGYTIIVKIVEREFEPLYWSKTEGLKQIIYFNKIHPKAHIFTEPNFVKFLFALGRTSLSFSDNSGEIFFNRLKNYIDLT